MTPDRPELLAPAGDWPALRAAVAQGADAVYFGVEAFNARLRAENFHQADLPEIMAWLHARGVKGFLTLNVLIFTAELEDAARLLNKAWRSGVDALIVQDLGLCMLARQLVPELPLHASTQMSITSAAGVAQASAAGCERVVMARELTLKDLERLQRQLQERGLRMPLEVFVHGALCVAYSGQCLTSESLGQRSANRGECAQACRLPYQLVVDGVERDLDDQRYLLSPQDLAAWSLVPELVRIGISSFKIEGRLKDATYVAAVTDVYRRCLDGLDLDVKATDRQLELGFSRGLTTGWLEGIDHPALVHGRWSKKRGPLIGHLSRIQPRGWLEIEAEQAPQRGQGVVLEAITRDADPFHIPREVGGRVMDVASAGQGRWRLRLGPGRIRLDGLRSGAPLWLTSDPQWQSTWQRRADRESAPLDAPLDLIVRGRSGEPLLLELVSPNPEGMPPLQVRSERCLEPARDHGLDARRLRAQLGRLGGTGWQLADLQVDVVGEVFLPIAELNRLRRKLLQCIAEAGVTPLQRVEFPAMIPENSAQDCVRAVEACLKDPPSRPLDQASDLVVLVRSLEQLQALQDISDEVPLRAVVADLEHPRELRQAVAMGAVAGLTVSGSQALALSVQMNVGRSSPSCVRRLTAFWCATPISSNC